MASLTVHPWELTRMDRPVWVCYQMITHPSPPKPVKKHLSFTVLSKKRSLNSWQVTAHEFSSWQPYSYWCLFNFILCLLKLLAQQLVSSQEMILENNVMERWTLNALLCRVNTKGCRQLSLKIIMVIQSGGTRNRQNKFSLSVIRNLEWMYFTKHF